VSTYSEKLEQLQRLRNEVRRLEAATETQAKSMSPLTESDEARMRNDQALYDLAYIAANRKAPPPLGHERPGPYVRRLAAGLQAMSPDWSKVDVATLPDGVFAHASAQIRSDAVKNGRTYGLRPGEIRQRTSTSGGGHTVIEFDGIDAHFTEQFRRPPRAAVWINESDRAAVRPPIETRAYPQMVQVPRASF